MKFSDNFLNALSAWQNGWGEDQSRRATLASDLMNTSKELDTEFRKVDRPCYRKRFLHKGELIDIILGDEKKEGLVSWTINQEFAERFKGLSKIGAVSGAIFEHVPLESEVVVNIYALWQSEDFIKAANAFKIKYPDKAKALFHFKGSQGEIVLQSPLRGSEIIALTGASSPFDDLCDQLEIPDAERDDIFAELVKTGVCPGKLKYTSKVGTQRVIANTIKRVHTKVLEYKTRGRGHML